MNTSEEALVDHDMGVKYWHHPAETITFLTEDNEEQVQSKYNSLTEASQSRG
jgi:hypothetical protein